MTKTPDRTPKPKPPRPRGRTVMFLGLLFLSSALMYAELALRFSR